MKTDLELRDRVLGRLELEPKIDPAALGVSVKDGVVTLRGSVESEDDRASTERVVRVIEGVRGLIDDELWVKSAPHPQPQDAQIQAKVREAIEWLTTVPQENIRVTACNGWVTLEGEIEELHQAHSIEAIVRDLPGVHGVKNDLKVSGQ